jgi:plastocyanin
MIKSGGTWAHTFTTAGSFAYSCILHPNMRGTINVGSSASGGGSAGLATEAATAGPASGTTAQADAASPAGTSTDPAILPVNVDVADNEFRPNPATVATGGTVTWKLVGAAAHTVTADDQSFNSGLLKPGETFQHTFNTLGSFTYTCLVHPGMVGTIEVVPPAQAAEQQAAPVSGDGPQAQPPAAAPATIAATDPPGDSGIWGQTLLGIAAVLTACCALVFALKSFLKVLGSPEPEGQVAASSDGLTPHAV